MLVSRDSVWSAPVTKSTPTRFHPAFAERFWGHYLDPLPGSRGVKHGSKFRQTCMRVQDGLFRGLA